MEEAVDCRNLGTESAFFFPPSPSESMTWIAERRVFCARIKNIWVTEGRKRNWSLALRP